MRNFPKKSSLFFFKSLWLICIFFYSCNEEAQQQTFTVKNNLEIDRKSETIRVTVDQINSLAERYGAENLHIRELNGQEALLIQLIDANSDGQTDEIIFQTNIGAHEEKQFVIEEKKAEMTLSPSGEGKAFSRFVPENNEDYAWENDRIAFRAYGAVTEARESGGKVSGGTSGVDAWLKRVEYPIIDKWYKKNQEEKGKKEAGAPHTDTYHTDTGEGYDPYMVGPSRGIGGTGIWEHDSLYVSNPFIEYKRIASGPIRTIFELSYAPISTNGLLITEKKRVSLDLGSNLSRFEVSIHGNSNNGNGSLPPVAAGIALHDKDGAINAVPEEGWFRYWEPMDDSELGTGIVLDPENFVAYKDHLEPAAQGNLLVIMQPGQQKTIYYAGYSWKKSGQFNSPEKWDRYLQDFAMRLNSPLEVRF